MTFRSALIDRVLVVQFSTALGVSDLTILSREMSNARRSVSAPVHLCLMLTAEGAELPDAELRGALNRFVTQTLTTAEAIDLVMCGDGAGAMLVRTIWRGLVSNSRWHGKVFVHADTTPAFARIAEAIHVDAAQLATRIRQSPILNGSPAASSPPRVDDGQSHNG